MYKIGSSQNFLSIIPGTVTGVPEEKGDATELPPTMLPRQTEKEEAVFTTNQPRKETTEKDKFTVETTSTNSTQNPTSSSVPKTSAVVSTEKKTWEEDFREVVTEYLESMSPATPTYKPYRIYNTDPVLDQTGKPTQSEPQPLEEVTTTKSFFLPSELLTAIPETSETLLTQELLTVAPSSPELDHVEPHYTPAPRSSPIAPRFPESKPVEPQYTSPEQVQQVPPYSRSHQPQIVVVDEDEDLNVDGNKSFKVLKVPA